MRPISKHLFGRSLLGGRAFRPYRLHLYRQKMGGTEGDMMSHFDGLVLDVTTSDATLDKDFLERLGHPVLVCHGPAWGRACPIIKGVCPMVEAAHGVIFQLDLDRPQHRVILKRYQEVLDEDVPIMAVVTPEQEQRYADLLGGVKVWHQPPTIAELDGFAAQTEASDEFRTDSEQTTSGG